MKEGRIRGKFIVFDGGGNFSIVEIIIIIREFVLYFCVFVWGIELGGEGGLSRERLF